MPRRVHFKEVLISQTALGTERSSKDAAKLDIHAQLGEEGLFVYCISKTKGSIIKRKTRRQQPFLLSAAFPGHLEQQCSSLKGQKLINIAKLNKP